MQTTGRPKHQSGYQAARNEEPSALKRRAKTAAVACDHVLHGVGRSVFILAPFLMLALLIAGILGWRQLPVLDESWRPDRSQVFVELEPHDGRTAISLVLLGNSLKTVRQPWFIDFIATGIRGNLPLMLGIPGPPGRQGASLELNTDAMIAAARTSRAAVKAVLEAELKLLSGYDFPPRSFRNHGNNVNAQP